MVAETARPATGDSRPGLDDLRGQAKSGLSEAQQALREQAQRRLRREQEAEQLHRLGGRAVFKFVDELARHNPDIADDIDHRLARYTSIDPALLRRGGNDRFPHPVIRVAGSGR